MGRKLLEPQIIELITNVGSSIYIYMYANARIMTLYDHDNYNKVCSIFIIIPLSTVLVAA